MIHKIAQQLCLKGLTRAPASTGQNIFRTVSFYQCQKPLLATLSNQPHYYFSQISKEENTQPREFADCIKDPLILDNLKKHGLTTMFPIQTASFDIVLKGGDILASDRTGSGKTLAYTLPILQQFHQQGINPAKIKKPKFLILSPTRELALQVTSQLNKFASDHRVVTVYGGSSISEQIRAIQRGVAIIVATPGRLIDLLDKGVVDLSDLKAVCLDEADTMLEKGFKLDVQRILEEVNQAAGQVQKLMFSATIPPWVAKIAKNYLTNMKKINLINDQDVRTSQTVEHYALMVKEQERHETVLQLIQRYNPQNRTIVFTHTKAQANDFIKYFDRDQIVILHGDIPQSVREVNLRKFRQGQQKILIATDVAARGLDIPNVDLIIQLSPPQNPEPYIHRSGRTGRAGKEGINITFFDQSNIEDLLAIEQQAKISIKIINNNFNISLWKKEADRLLEEISTAQKDNEDPFYQLFVNQILKRTSPEQALLYFLKHKLGKIPQMTSAITNKKGYITYVAYKTKDHSLSIQEIFKGIPIYNLTQDQQQVKFDILWNDYYHFQQTIDTQDSYELEIYDENNNFTLKKFALSLRKKYKAPSNSQSNSRQPRHKPYESRHQTINNIEAGKKLFIPKLPSSLTQEQIQEEITRLTGVSKFRLKVITRLDNMGEKRSFGFLELQNQEDVHLFLGQRIKIGHEVIWFKPSNQNK